MSAWSWMPSIGGGGMQHIQPYYIFHVLTSCISYIQSYVTTLTSYQQSYVTTLTSYQVFYFLPLLTSG